MPSVKPSKFERAELSDDELEEGYRIRPAWEISIMGEGQQVVLPPSVHPDTGGKYNWSSPIADWKDLPLLDLGTGETSERPAESASKFEVAEVDLFDSRLSPDVVDLIVSGKDCKDRSAALFIVATAMVKQGYTDNEILTVLTDPDTYLGECAYDHAQTESRKRAARWVDRYTLTKVKREHSAEAVFREEVEASELSEIEAKAQFEHMTEPGDWREKIERVGGHAGGPPKPTMKNVHLILSNDVGRNLILRNDFSHSDTYGRSAPWGGARGGEIREVDFTRVKFWLAEHYRFEPPTSVIIEALQKIGDENRFHPVRDFLRSLEWDGVERLDGWLKTYMGATGPDLYLSAVGRKTLIGMVARIMEPGIKFDTVLILEGRQGCGKSTAVKILADPWFSDAAIDVGDKDSVLALQGVWVLEMGELSGLRKADVDSLKQFVSQATDRIRVPYGRLTESFPRQSIFIGTTNPGDYLKDTTGNRRFWPVSVEQCEFAKLKADRDQLLAEAVFKYDLGEDLHLAHGEEEKLAAREQAKRTFVDEWVSAIGSFLKSKPENFDTKLFTISDLFSLNGPLNGHKDHRGEQMRVGDALRQLGYTRRKTRRDGAQAYLWSKKG
jgi:predicted P-loop ATPase